jgi:colicin import membrane protein
MELEEWQMSSEYEHNVGKLLTEKRAVLDELMKKSEANRSKIAELTLEVEALEAMYENYNLGMNVFRRAQGGRHGLRE